MKRIEDVKNKVHLCDCMDFMKDKPDNYYDLAIVDPPYGIERLNRPGRLDHLGDTTKWNHLIPNNKYFKELLKISKNQIIWGANYFDKKIGQNFIIWDKREGFIPPRNYADCEIASCSKKGVARIFRFYWDGFLQKKKKNAYIQHKNQSPYINGYFKTMPNLVGKYLIVM